MHVISYRRIREFILKYPDSAIKLKRWYKWMSKGKFQDHNDLRKRFPDMDYIGNDRYVFNIAANKYRLVALVNFCKQKVYVRFLGTHAEYSRTDCKNI